MAKPRAPKRPKPPKPWERETPGRYRSSDGRFTIDQEGAGRWFVIDREQQDELGLARTLGPFDTLDDAKAKADEQRAAAAEESPLRARLADAAAKPKLTVMAGGRPKADGAADDRRPGEAATAEPPPPPKPKPTWLDRLPAADQRRARAWIEALEGLGVAKAEQIVRRDIEGGVPAVATAVLARALARAALTPSEGRELARMAARLERGGAKDEDIRAYAALVAEDVLERALAVLSARERDPDAPSRLPGWRLVEVEAEGAGGRRLILSADEVLRSE